ncbi:MAG: hypothetical protein PUP92_28495 [Rhizonema sp. PD38]|nr:hypothetical protein [Rhizonema sp. PD38]
MSRFCSLYLLFTDLFGFVQDRNRSGGRSVIALHFKILRWILNQMDEQVTGMVFIGYSFPTMAIAKNSNQE